MKILKLRVYPTFKLSALWKKFLEVLRIQTFCSTLKATYIIYVDTFAIPKNFPKNSICFKSFSAFIKNFPLTTKV
jgi:hypothetical protein